MAQLGPTSAPPAGLLCGAKRTTAIHEGTPWSTRLGAPYCSSGHGRHTERARVDTTIVKALARAFQWRKLLEAGSYGTIKELAAAEKINPSYISRVLRMTLLAPDIVEAVLNGTMHPA